MFQNFSLKMILCEAIYKASAQKFKLIIACKERKGVKRRLEKPGHCMYGIPASHLPELMPRLDVSFVST